MLQFFKKQKNTEKEDGIVVLRRPEPQACGGTTATQDTRAPKTILSEEMTFFTAFSALPYSRYEGIGRPPLHFVAAYAAPASDGTLLYLETYDSMNRRGRGSAWAYVKDDPFPALEQLTREEDLAKNNGFHSKTHGLPENFGGEILIRYASGEKISVSDNQTPILSRRAGERIAAFFAEAMRGERVPLPELSTLREIRFAEERPNGGFTRATLTIQADGTAVNRKEQRFDDPTVYRSEKKVDAEAVAAIRAAIERCALLAWPGLPKRAYLTDKNKTLTFVFADGQEIVVDYDSEAPDALRGGFFDIELEMSTKH